MPSEHTSVRLGEVAGAIPESANVSAECREYLRRKYVAQEVKTVATEDVDRMHDALDDLHDALEQINTASAQAIESVQALREIAADTEDRVTRPEEEPLREAIQPLATLPEDKRHAENPAIQTKANKHGVDTQTVLDALSEHYPTDRFGNPVTDTSQIDDAVTG